MNAVLVLVLGFIVFFIGYRWYAGYIDSHIIKADRQKGHPREDVHGRGRIHADEQERAFWLSVQIDRRGGADHRPYHRHSVGLAPRADLDIGRRPLYRLGPGLFERHDSDAQRGRVVRGLEPQAYLAQGAHHPSLIPLLLSAAYRGRIR